VNNGLLAFSEKKRKLKDGSGRLESLTTLHHFIPRNIKRKHTKVYA